MLEMRVKGLALDQSTNMPIIILEDLAEERALPIWVGTFEANAIALEMENVPTPRPMTHDLIKNILDGVQATVSRIVVNDLKDNTFYAIIFLSMNGNEIAIDSRPSDAIALALRVGAPIYVAERVLEEGHSFDLTEQEQEHEDEERERLKEWLENLRPEDFGTPET